MFCRRVWQRVAPLTRRVLKRAPRNGAPVRLMASGLPGGSFNTTYFVLCGGGLTAALVYAYKTISNSHPERYESGLASVGSTAKANDLSIQAVGAPRRHGSAPRLPARQKQLLVLAAAAPAAAEEAEVTEVVAEFISGPAEEAAEASAEAEAAPEAAAAGEASEEPASQAAPGEAEETAAETSEVEDAAPPAGPAEETSAERESAGTAAVDEVGAAPPAAAAVAA